MNLPAVLILASAAVAVACAGRFIPAPTAGDLILDQDEVLPVVEARCQGIKPSFLSFGASANRFEFAYDRPLGEDVESSWNSYKAVTGHPTDRLFWARAIGGDDYTYDAERDEFKIEDDRQMHLVGNLKTSEDGDCTTFTMVMTDRTWGEGVELKVEAAQLFRVGEDKSGKPVATSTIAAFNCRLNIRNGAREAAICRQLQQCLIWG